MSLSLGSPDNDEDNRVHSTTVASLQAQWWVVVVQTPLLPFDHRIINDHDKPPSMMHHHLWLQWCQQSHRHTTSSSYTVPVSGMSCYSHFISTWWSPALAMSTIALTHDVVELHRTSTRYVFLFLFYFYLMISSFSDLDIRTDARLLQAVSLLV